MELLKKVIYYINYTELQYDKTHSNLINNYSILVTSKTNRMIY